MENIDRIFGHNWFTWKVLTNFLVIISPHLGHSLATKKRKKTEKNFIIESVD